VVVGEARRRRQAAPVRAQVPGHGRRCAWEAQRRAGKRVDRARGWKNGGVAMNAARGGGGGAPAQQSGATVMPRCGEGYATKGMKAYNAGEGANAKSF